MELTNTYDAHSLTQQPLSLLHGAPRGTPPDITVSKDPSDAKRRLVEAGQQFEAYFISHLMKVMRETVPKGVIANKQGAYFESFYDQEIGLRAAQSGGIGIADMVETYVQKNYSLPPAKPSSSSR